MASADVFPVGIAESVDPLPSHLPKSLGACRTVAFRVYVREEVVEYDLIAMKMVTLTHLQTTVHLLADRSLQQRHWMDVYKSLSRQSKATRNLDTRIGFRYAGHQFIVKKHFSFGQRTVAPGTLHLYHIGDVAVRLFYLPRLYQTSERLKERCFRPLEECLYEMRVLEAGRAYALPEGTVYLLLTSDRSFFSVHTIRYGADVQVPFDNPIEDRSSCPPVERPLEEPRRKRARTYRVEESSSGSSPDRSVEPIQPATTYAQPATTYAQPATTYAQPATTYAQPATTYVQPAAVQVSAAEPERPATTYAQPAAVQVSAAEPERPGVYPEYEPLSDFGVSNLADIDFTTTWTPSGTPLSQYLLDLRSPSRGGPSNVPTGPEELRGDPPAEYGVYLPHPNPPASKGGKIWTPVASKKGKRWTNPLVASKGWTNPPEDFT